MAEIFLYNSLSKSVEEFEPLVEGRVGMYHCGPTVYDDVHIGNLRAFFLADILRRTFEWNEYEVTQVMNITDVGHLSDDGDHGDDKMTRALKRENKTITLEAMLELATKYQERFMADLEKLHIQMPHHVPRASEHIAENIDIIEKLFEQGYAYETSDSIYFDTEKYPEYGQLGLPPIDESQSRTGVNEEKKNPRDFALWKKDENLGWPSPWGQGFPGWHIECSGMSQKYLGAHFDIHTGGIDLKPTHHNNEIAQSVCCSNTPFVNYWLHNEHLSLSSGKMSKSEGNSITLNTLIEEGFHPLDYRYWLLQSSYRTKTDFSLESLKAAQTARKRLTAHMDIELLDDIDFSQTNYVDRFTKAISNDLGTPEALSIAWEVAKDEELSKLVRGAILKHFDRVLGIHEIIENVSIPAVVAKLVEEREEARARGNWDEADALRNEISTHGFKVLDSEAGSLVEPL